MLGFGAKRKEEATREGQRLQDLEAQVAAMDRSQAVIEFELDGTVIRANDNFCRTLGYTAAEIEGRHHSMFCSPAYAATQEYKDFWRRLNNGEFSASKYLRIGKGGREIWIQASYNPVLDKTGRPYKVIKFATDITAAEVERAENDVRRGSEEEQKVVVGKLAEGLRRLAGGDLTVRIDATFTGDYQQLKDDFNAAVGALRTAMSSITEATGAINAGSREIAGASDDLSKRTEQQAASLEQTAAALDQITATVKRTAQGAQQAAGVVTTARSDAEHSGEVVQGAVAAMGEIEKSSNEISQIIGVIDEIAFQTNLLALNAGVEAARAGEAGRGFAVVASEVRALAQRSAQAAKEIKTLISASSQQVGQGVKLVGQTGEALSTIVGKVAEIHGLVAEISASAQEQATALAEVNSSVNHMDQMTQQNAAMVEQSTAAARSLQSEANELAGLIGGFDLGGHGYAARPVPAPARAPAPAMTRAPAYAPAPAPAPAPVLVTPGAPAPYRATAFNADNPVHAARAKVAAYVNGSRSTTAEASWEEF